MKKKRDRLERRSARHAVNSYPKLSVRSALRAASSCEFMLQAVNYVSSNALGTGQLDCGFVPCFRVSYGALISPCSSRGTYTTLSHVRVPSKRYPFKDVSFICKVGYNGHSRNPSYDQQNGLGISASSNWKKEKTERLENLKESKKISLEVGLIDSLSSTPRSKVTEIPGPKEKEIVELFRKIQVQLRERSIAKERPTVESLQGKTSENGTVDSLLKLLRKHSSDQVTRKLNMYGKIGSIMDHSVQNGAPNGFRDLELFKSSNHASFDSKEHKPDSSASLKPGAYFRRKSPVPQTKRQHSPVYRRRNTMDFSPYIRNKSASHTPEPDSEKDLKAVANLPSEHELEHEHVLSNVDMHHKESDEGVVDSDSNHVTDESEREETESINFTTLKLTELRSIAKTRGIKGLSKLKKSELAELLRSSSE